MAKKTPDRPAPEVDADAILADARLPEASVPVCTRGDLIAEVEELERQVRQVALAQAADPRIAGTGTDAQVARIQQLREQIQASTVVFRLRALPRRRWAKLVEDHPPRMVDGVTHDEDRALGVNTPALFAELLPMATVTPQLKPETWDAITSDDGPLTDEQYTRLCTAAWNLNRAPVDVPFSLAGSLMTATTGGDSGSPEPSA